MLDKLVNPKKLDKGPFLWKASLVPAWAMPPFRPRPLSGASPARCDPSRRRPISSRPRCLFLQLSFLRLFRTILDDPATKKEKRFRELRAFLKMGVISRTLHDAEQQQQRCPPGWPVWSARPPSSPR